MALVEDTAGTRAETKCYQSYSSPDITQSEPKYFLAACRGCGYDIHASALSCPNCGARHTGPIREFRERKGTRHRLAVKILIVAIFLGWTGAHHFMVKNYFHAVLMLITSGGFFIVALIDVIQIIRGQFTDENGERINW